MAGRQFPREGHSGDTSMSWKTMLPELVDNSTRFISRGLQEAFDYFLLFDLVI